MQQPVLCPIKLGLGLGLKTASLLTVQGSQSLQLLDLIFPIKMASGFSEHLVQKITVYVLSSWHLMKQGKESRQQEQVTEVLVCRATTCPPKKEYWMLLPQPGARMVLERQGEY
eukprot:3941616-Rhodomonas_salina.1